MVEQTNLFLQALVSACLYCYIALEKLEYVQKCFKKTVLDKADF